MSRSLPLITKLAPAGKLVLAAGMALAVLWAYWPTLADMAQRWSTNPQYSHGYLVPLFALFLLWQRRDRLAGVTPGLSWAIVPLLALGCLLRLAGAYLYMDWLDALSLLPTLAAAVLVLAGKGSLRWAGPSILFLVFMMPLPYRLDVALALALQRAAAALSGFALQTLGYPALVEGNIILVNQHRLNVAHACSGLSMLMTFFALSAGVALLIRRPLPDRLLVLASAVPVAMFANVARITLTGVLYETVSDRAAQLVFHDLAGWLMMPLALGVLALELHVLGRLLAPAPEKAAAVDLVQRMTGPRVVRRKRLGAAPR